MDTIRFIHTADWQLGMTRHFLSPEAQARFTGARLDAVRAIGALAADEGCSFVVVCGDVFETNQVDRQVIVRALDAMREQPEVTFYLLPGNHDPLDASSVFRSSTFTTTKPDNVVVLDSSEPVMVAPGVEIVGAPWCTKHPVTDLAAAALAEAPAGDAVRILVAHGCVDALSPDKLDPKLLALASLEAAVHEKRVHYVALGDKHSTTGVGDTGAIWYSGAPEPTRYDEPDPGNALVVTMDPSDGRVQVEPHRVGTWRFIRHDADVNSPEDVAALSAWLDSLDNKERAIVKLALVGSISLAAAATLEEILAHHRDLLGALETWERRSDLLVLPDDADLAALNVTGFAADAAADLRVRADHDSDDAVVARDALALLYRLARGAA